MKVYFRSNGINWDYLTEYGEFGHIEHYPMEVEKINGEYIESYHITGVDKEANEIWDLYDSRCIFDYLNVKNERYFVADVGSDYPKIKLLYGEFIEPKFKSDGTFRNPADYMEFYIPKHIQKVIVIINSYKDKVSSSMYDIVHER